MKRRPNDNGSEDKVEQEGLLREAGNVEVRLVQNAEGLPHLS